jgi:hypothetical protein
MSICVAQDQRFAWSVAADHYLCRYELFDSNPQVRYVCARPSNFIPLTHLDFEWITGLPIDAF